MTDRHAMPEEENIPKAAYFLSLTVADFRCFGSELQTLDLSDGNGKPSQWTVILGENGTGKTTLLQCMAAMETRLKHREQKTSELLLNPYYYEPSGIEAFILGYLPDEPYFSQDFEIRVDAYCGVRLCGDDIGQVIKDFGMWNHNGYIQKTQVPYAWENPRNTMPLFVIYGYGSLRRMSRKALSDFRSYESSITLADSSAELPNAEDWLVQADYATLRAPEDQKKRINDNFQRGKSLLIKIL